MDVELGKRQTDKEMFSIAIASTVLPMTTKTARQRIRSFIMLNMERRVAGPELLTLNDGLGCLIRSRTLAGIYKSRSSV